MLMVAVLHMELVILRKTRLQRLFLCAEKLGIDDVETDAQRDIK